MLGYILRMKRENHLGFDPVEGYDDLRVPANIAGSAANPDEGGRPVEGDDTDG